MKVSKVDYDWVKSLIDIDSKRNKLKIILQEGANIFVPNNCNFSTRRTKRWKRPVNKETRTHIELKKIFIK